MVIPCLADVGQRDLGKHPIAKVEAMIAILGGGEDELGLGHVTGVQVQRPRFGVIGLIRVLLLPLVGLVFPIGQTGRVDKSGQSYQSLLQPRPHRWRVIATSLERYLVGNDHRFAPSSGQLFDRPTAGRIVPRDDATEPDHRLDETNRCHVKNLACVGPLIDRGDTMKTGGGREAYWTAPMAGRHEPTLRSPYTIDTPMMHPWISQRADSFDSSGIRKVFDLAAKLTDPINLSIGQPDFDVPAEVKSAAIEAIESGKNAYSPTQGIGPLREAMKKEIQSQYPDHGDRDLFISSGTSGGLMLSMLAMVNPGDEVIYLDPYFVMYPALVQMCGGVPVPIDSYPDFRLDPEKIAAAISPRTKMILLNSPANPTGVTAGREALKAVAQLAAEKNVALVSDEIYSRFFYDGDFVSPAQFNDQTIVIDGFSKSHAMTGWRVGYVHGPSEITTAMLKLQQYSFVCAPQPAQWGALRALEVSLDGHIEDYRRKRDLIYDGLRDCYEITKPGGAFYIYPKSPTASGEKFVEEAISRGLLIIPGNIFSHRDSHFRISFAAPDETLHRGIELLRELAKR